MDNTNEIWKPVVGFEGYYEVSNMGRVRSLDRSVIFKDGRKRLINGRVLRVENNNNGYQTVSLYKNGKEKRNLIHRLVAQAFIPNPYNLPEVNHINEAKTDNRSENLEWCTRKYNNEYSNIIEKAIERRFWEKAGKVERPVLQYTKDGEFVAEYPSTREAERQTGIKHVQISAVCNGKKWFKSAGGFVWSYNKKMKKV